MADQQHQEGEDPEGALADEFDDPNHNPFQNSNEETADDDDEERSVASQQLRDNFIRLTTQGGQEANNDNAAVVGAPHQYDYTAFNQNGYVTIRNTTQGQSLARATTTPPQLSYLLPVACVLTHCLFIYGQVAPMWKLSLTAEDVSVWANSTSLTSNLLFDALQLDHHSHFTAEHNHTVQEFTYGYAVQELWQAKGMRDAWLAQMAAIGLVVFSGIWPHLKLMLLQHAWMTPTTRPNRRTSILSWLALLGKWSLADVLTVCVMVGVLNLEWVLDPSSIKTGIANNLHTLLDLGSQVWSVPTVCTWALSFDTTDCNKVSVKHMPACRLCKSFVSSAYNNPETVENTGKKIVKDIAMGGGGIVRLSVKGMKGIYFFCAAVIFSVLLSVVVEWYNHLFLETLRKERGEEADNSLALTEEEEGMSMPPIRTADANSDAYSEPLLLEDAPPRYEPMEIMDDSASVFSGIVQRTTASPSYQFLQCHHILPVVCLLFVGLAVYLPSMERHVGGAIPDLLKEILGVDFDKTYSLSTLKDTTGAAGGWDLLLMATFGLFCVVGPLLRAILVVLVAMTKPTEDTKRIRALFVRASRFLAAFCAWEVFLVAMVMVELIMPTATDTILNTEACHIVSKDGDSCLHVAYERVHTTFACLVLGFILIGGLSIHVSLEDKKERQEGEEEPATSTQDHHYSGLPPTEINTTPSYATVPTNAPASPVYQEGDNNEGNVTTMIQEELV